MVGIFPSAALTAANSDEAKKTSAPCPNLFGKLRVDVDTTVELAATRA